jgi:hypothetical protein
LESGANVDDADVEAEAATVAPAARTCCKGAVKAGALVVAATAEGVAADGEGLVEAAGREVRGMPDFCNSCTCERQSQHHHRQHAGL